MYIESVPNRASPPAILLRESYREGGKVCKRTLCNLSNWPKAHIEGLRGVLNSTLSDSPSGRSGCGWFTPDGEPERKQRKQLPLVSDGGGYASA
jgi:hypothetical protein